jgi:regulator of replication initiation timing
MPETMVAGSLDIHSEDARLRNQLEQLQGENKRLRSENQQLRAALDAHVARAASAAAFGPLEMTAGTCVGPRRRRREVPQPGHDS